MAVGVKRFVIIGMICGETTRFPNQAKSLFEIKSSRLNHAAPGTGGNGGDAHIHTVFVADLLVFVQEDFGEGLAGIAETQHSYL